MPYDNNGNLIQKRAGEVAVNYLYNAKNQLVNVEDNLTGLVIAGYAYDPFGRRLWKEVDGVRTYFFYSDEGLIAEYDEDRHGNPLVWLQAGFHLDDRPALAERRRRRITGIRTTTSARRKKL